MMDTPTKIGRYHCGGPLAHEGFVSFLDDDMTWLSGFRAVRHIGQVFGWIHERGSGKQRPTLESVVEFIAQGIPFR